jgi:hypothetical protein
MVVATAVPRRRERFKTAGVSRRKRSLKDVSNASRAAMFSADVLANRLRRMPARAALATVGQ